MRIVATADLHGYLPGMNSQQEIPECDLLLIAGDVCPVWDHTLVFQRSWLDSTFRTWLKELPAKNIVGIAGNHDFYFLERKSDGLDLPWTYLMNSSAEIEGLKIWGSPYSNRFGKWAFMKDEKDLAVIWDTIPRDIDILLVHGPPNGFGDKVGKVWSQREQKFVDEYAGSTSLRNHLEYETWPNLKMVVFGHIHEGYGEDSLKSWRMLNVSQMNEEYEPVNSPMVIDL